MEDFELGPINYIFSRKLKKINYFLISKPNIILLRKKETYTNYYKFINQTIKFNDFRYEELKISLSEKLITKSDKFDFKYSSEVSSAIEESLWIKIKKIYDFYEIAKNHETVRDSTFEEIINILNRLT